MTTQVMFRINQDLKNKLSKKAKNDGVSLSTIFNQVARAYVDGEIVLKMTAKKEVLKESVRKELIKCMEDFKHGRNLSKSFDNADEAIRYLKAL